MGGSDSIPAGSAEARKPAGPSSACLRPVAARVCIRATRGPASLRGTSSAPPPAPPRRQTLPLCRCARHSPGTLAAPLATCGSGPPAALAVASVQLILRERGQLAQFARDLRPIGKQPPQIDAVAATSRLAAGFANCLCVVGKVFTIMRARDVHHAVQLRAARRAPQLLRALANGGNDFIPGHGFPHNEKSHPERWLG